MKINDINLSKRKLADEAVSALVDELNLTPKPGLVDRNDSGVHQDLTYDLMMKSAQSLRVTFEKIADVSFGREVSLELREEIARIGREGEKVMMKTTGGTNSHKGAIWSLGLLVSSAAIHYCHVSAHQLLRTAGEIARLNDRFAPVVTTNGSRVKKRYNVIGAKEQAEMGFPHIAKYGLPTLIVERAKGREESIVRLHTLIALISQLDDTCILYRGGMTALNEAKKWAELIIKYDGITSIKGSCAFTKLTQSLHDHNASPGGAADLLAATLFVDRISHSQTLSNEIISHPILTTN